MPFVWWGIICYGVLESHAHRCLFSDGAAGGSYKNRFWVTARGGGTGKIPFARSLRARKIFPVTGTPVHFKEEHL